MNITNFPFRRLGELLRNMSLSGTFGNLCAWALLVLLSLIPVAVLVVLRLRKKSLRVDYCLIPIAIAEAVTIYLSVNPMLIGDWSMLGAPIDADRGVSVITCAFYSLVFCYLVLRFSLKLLRGSREETLRLMELLCILAAIVLVAVTFSEVYVFVKEQSGIGDTTPFDDAFRIGKAVFGIISDIALAATFLLTALVVRRYRREGATQALERSLRAFTVFCVVEIVAYLLLVAAYNVMQLVLIKRLTSVNVSMILPLSDLIVIAFIPAALHMIREAREVKEENSLYI